MTTDPEIRFYSDARDFDDLVSLALSEGFTLTNDHIIVSPGRTENEHVSILYWDSVYMNGDVGAEDFTFGESESCSWYLLDEHDARVCGQPTDNVETWARVGYDPQGFLWLTYYRLDVDAEEYAEQLAYDRAREVEYGDAEDSQ